MGAVVARCYDSNIIIDWLRGIEAAERELDSVDVRVISVMTWIEVLSGVRSEHEEGRARRLFGNFRVVPVDLAISERALGLRKGRRIKLVDATIHATALDAGLQLSTRNTRDFSEADPTIRVPYRL